MAFALALFTVSWWNFDYSSTGIQLMLIFLPLRSRLKISKWFFYGFYPAHLALIALVRNLM